MQAVQQIAGRAGRFDRYALGLFQSTRMRKGIARRFAQAVPDIETKLTVLALATMPFDERNRVLKAAWRQMAQAVLEGRRARLFIPGEPRDGMDLASLEADYHYCDLLYNYERSFGDQERCEQLIERREQISRAIMAMLARDSG